MRHGVKVAPTAPLARKAPEDSDAGSELLLMEMNLLKAYRAHLAQKAGKAAPTATKAIAKTATVAPAAAKPAPSEAKAKIVRALRKKK
jgi:hypothetical protein